MLVSASLGVLIIQVRVHKTQKHTHDQQYTHTVLREGFESGVHAHPISFQYGDPSQFTCRLVVCLLVCLSVHIIRFVHCAVCQCV